MSNKQNTGGPAFPAQFFDERATGMTMRDYFAAQAMASLLTVTARRDDKNYNEDALASLSYTVADAMLEARK